MRRPSLTDTAQSGYDDSKALIERWHGRGRLGYAVTPRFAPTSTPAQLDAAGALLREHPGVWLQTHLAENHDEIAWVARLFPGRARLPRRLRAPRAGRTAQRLRPRHPPGRGRVAAAARGGRRDRPLPDVEHLPRQRTLPPSRRAARVEAGARGTGHRRRRRNDAVDAGDDGRGVQGGANGRRAARRGAAAVARHRRGGAGARPRRRDGDPRAGRGRRLRGARPRRDAAAALPDAVLPRRARTAGGADARRGRPRDSRDLVRRALRPRPRRALRRGRRRRASGRIRQGGRRRDRRRAAGRGPPPAVPEPSPVRPSCPP